LALVPAGTAWACYVQIGQNDDPLANTFFCISAWVLPVFSSHAASIWVWNPVSCPGIWLCSHMERCYMAHFPVLATQNKIRYRKASEKVCLSSSCFNEGYRVLQCVVALLPFTTERSLADRGMD
jgi:hypothetical protein